MTHDVCGTPVRWFYATDTSEHPTVQDPYCPLCNRTVDSSELGPDRVSAGRSWEVDDDPGDCA